VAAIRILQLDQYDEQGMFGTPVLMNNEIAVFHSVWAYVKFSQANACPHDLIISMGLNTA
jgi:hypothetical protein